MAGQPEGMEFGVEVGVGLASTIIKFDDIIEGRQAAVVHVLGGARDLPQRRRFEGAMVCILASHREAPRVRELAVPPGNAGIMEALIAEVWTHVARRAVSLAAENL